MTFLAIAKSDVLGPEHLQHQQPRSVPAQFAQRQRHRLPRRVLGVDGGRDLQPRARRLLGGRAGRHRLRGRSARQRQGLPPGDGLLSWDTRTWGASASYDKLYGGPGAANGLTRSDTDRRISLNGYAMVGRAKIGAGAIERRIDAASDGRLAVLPGRDLYLRRPVAARCPAVAPGRQGHPKTSTLAVLRATYCLSKRTAVHGSLGHMQNKGGAAIALDAGGTVGAGLNRSGVMLGHAPHVLNACSASGYSISFTWGSLQAS